MNRGGGRDGKLVREQRTEVMIFNPSLGPALGKAEEAAVA